MSRDSLRCFAHLDLLATLLQSFPSTLCHPLDAAFLIYLSCPVTSLMLLPDQLLSSSPNLIQFVVIPFVQNILNSFFQILF